LVGWMVTVSRGLFGADRMGVGRSAYSNSNTHRASTPTAPFQHGSRMLLIRRRQHPTRVALLLLLAMCGSPEESAMVGDLDTDGDGILDVHEGEADPDADGLPAWQDTDSDGDWIPDAVEAGDANLATLPIDSDGDRTPDFLDLDSDGNGLSDRDEGLDGHLRPRDRDGDGVIDSADDDDDGDGIPDHIEMGDGQDRNSDSDRRADRLDLDSDGDGLADADEAWCFSSNLCDTDADGTPDVLDQDSDGDGLSDAQESGAPEGRLADPPRDTDGDGAPDAQDLDSDGDGIPDAQEAAGPTDGLLRDTDGDGLADGLEQSLGLDPVDPESRWRGRLLEVRPRWTREELFQAELGLHKLDVIFLHNPIQQERRAFVPVLQTLQEAMPDVDLAVGVTLVGGYGLYPWGCVEDPAACGISEEHWYRIEGPGWALLPFSPITTQVDRLLGWSPERTGGVPEWYWNTGLRHEGVSVLESVRQVVSGTGYDIECDGVFDPLIDQPPDPGGPRDLFGGRASSTVPFFAERAGVGPYGARQGAKRIIIDTGSGYRSLRSDVDRTPDADPADDNWYQVPPDLCPGHPSLDQVASMLREADVSLVALSRCASDYGEACGEPDPLNNTQILSNLAEASGSRLVTKSGTEPYWLVRPEGVDAWLEARGQFVPSVHGEHFRRVLDDIARQVDPDVVELEVREDAQGLVSRLSPSRFEGKDLGDSVTFTAELTGTVPPTEGDQGFIVRLAAVGDGTYDLYEEEVLVVVPGWGRR